MNMDMNVNYSEYHAYLLKELANAERNILRASDPERKEKLKMLLKYTEHRAVGAMEILKELNMPYEHFQCIVEMANALYQIKFK